MFIVIFWTLNNIPSKTESPILSINNVYGFTYKPSSENNSNNVNLETAKYQEIEDIEDSGLPFPEYIHKISLSAANPQNTTAIKDYKAIQKHMQKIEKSINVCDIRKSDFIISSDDALDLCMDQTSFVYVQGIITSTLLYVRTM